MLYNKNSNPRVVSYQLTSLEFKQSDKSLHLANSFSRNMEYILSY